MDPADFISLALRLSSSVQESELRTAISRAYYGAFHAARMLVEECGVRFPRKELLGADIHRKVRFCLAHAGDDDVVLIVNRLDSLRERRNEADYDLTSDKFSTAHSNNLKTNVRNAVQVVDALQRYRVEPALSALRENVRAYARDVLRLPVEDGD